MLALLLICAALLAGCRPLVDEGEKQISVYATFYPIYALTDAVMKGVPNAELHCLVQPQDGCLRSYQLSDWDASLLRSGADAVISGGRGLESFESALFGWGEGGPAVSAVLYNLELYNQQQKASGETESHLVGANPHLYMSLEGAGQIVESVCAMLLSMDPGYAGQYADNADEALEALKELLEENREVLKPFMEQQVALMNEALIYPALDYGLEVAEWIDRESGAAMGDNELSGCLERLSDSQVRVVLIEKQAPQALVHALEEAGYSVARLDVLSTHREGEGFDSYLEIQKNNALALERAFEGEMAN